MATGGPGVTVLRPLTRLYNLWKNESGEVTIYIKATRRVRRQTGQATGAG